MSLVNKIKLSLAAVGPGIFLIGYNIGTGSVTTMAKSGAEYGMTLFWALILSVIFTYILMVAYGQVTLVTGKTALNNINKELKYGNILAVYILVALVVGEILALMGIMGIITDLLQEGIKLLCEGYHVDTFWLTLIIVISLFALLWNGQYKFFEKILIVFVIFMALSFIVVFFMVKPDFSTLISGLVPKIPNMNQVLYN